MRDRLAEIFAAATEPIRLSIAGHSLGGALAPTLALWLLDTREQWDPKGLASICVYAYAGPTPGNEHFSRHLEARFGGQLHRIANHLDPAVHLWDVNEVAEVKSLYTPELDRSETWDQLVDFAIGLTEGINYGQFDPDATILPGELQDELIWRWVPTFVERVIQGIYQHTVAYFDLLELEYPELRSAAGRHMIEHMDSFAEGALRLGGLDERAARALSVGLRLVSRAYARVPFAPSPLRDE